MKRLSQVAPGQKAIIRSFEKDEIFLKLMEMGCVPGEEVSIEQIAPLGDPISISITGYTLSLRLEEADLIWVEVQEDPKTIACE
jgi:ferrous iron transport protein A